MSNLYFRDSAGVKILKYLYFRDSAVNAQAVYFRDSAGYLQLFILQRLCWVSQVIYTSGDSAG
jgi:hypothetical protein